MAGQRSRLATWTRRSLIASAGVVGGGLALGVVLSPNRLKIADETTVMDDGAILNTWVKVSPDNTTTVFFPHAEMGQGVGTALAQMLAEEMEVDWDTVSIQQAPPTAAYANSDLGRGYLLGDAAYVPAFMFPLLDFTLYKVAGSAVGHLTGGSTAVRLTGQYGMRRAGAAAREMLVRAAAEMWAVPVSQLSAANSVVAHDRSDKQATYGELASKAATFTPNLKPELKATDRFHIVGKPKSRLDLPGKVDGTAKFGMDVSIPGMVYAAISLPPVHGARAIAVDQSGLTQRPGMGEVFNLGTVIVATADSYWTASRALEELVIDWQGGAVGLSSASIRARHDADLATGDLDIVDSSGDVERALASGTVVQATYDVPFLAHATMEPMNCTVSLKADRADIWIGHQNPLLARNRAAGRLDLDPSQVTVHPVLLGGGFGRRSENDVLFLSLRVAQAVNAPVKVIWSREMDITNDRYRPATVSHLEGVVENGRITAFRHKYTEARPRRSDMERPYRIPYDVPNRKIARVICPSALPDGPWRAVEFTQLSFFNEAFVDELAEAAGVDPLTFRFRNTSDARAKAVLERLAQAASWQDSLPPNHAQGVALVKSFGTIVAQAVEVQVLGDRVRVPRVTSVVDCGQLINPLAGEAQIAGSVVFALTAALFGEITVDGGTVQQRNFPDYDMLRLSNAPKQSVQFIESNEAPGGLGEPGVPPVAPALANAIYRATGTRVRSLPISKNGFRSV